MIFIYFRFVAPVVMAPVVLCVWEVCDMFFDPVVADMLDTRSVCVCVCVCGRGGGGASVYTGALGMKI